MAKRKRQARVKKSNTSKWGRPTDADVKKTYISATISIPSGACPAILEGMDRDSIRNWMIEITKTKPDAHTYQASVYKYWVRDFHESYSQEYKDIGNIIDTIAICPIRVVSDIGA